MYVRILGTIHWGFKQRRWRFAAAGPAAGAREGMVIRGGKADRTGHRPETTPHGGLALRAGPLTAELLDGNLRWLCAGRTALVQRIYVAVRDTAFNTVLPRVQVVDRSIGTDHFEIKIRARHRDRDIDFTWSGYISGSVDGRISYRFDGQAGGSFAYNKIGLNVIHPTTTHRGARVEASGGPDGPFDATLPRTVGPQAVRDGHIRGIIPPFRTISIHLDDGRLDLTFEGDDFEMEDERNWTETGFKSYSGPLSRPWPLTATDGMAIRQAITVEYHGAAVPVADTSPSVTIGQESIGRLPLLGHSVPDAGPEPSAKEVELLRLTRPGFVQADLRFDEADERFLSSTVATVAALDRPLLASVYVGDDIKGELDHFIEWTKSNQLRLQAVTVFARSAASALRAGTPAEVARVAVPMLRASLPGVAIAVGSDRFLSEVIRSRPRLHGADALAFGISPCGHTDEDWAIVDSLPAQGDAVLTLRKHLGAAPIYAGPVTLQTRFGSWPRHRFDRQILPLQVDVRQRDLLAAAWTLGSVAELALADVELATYFETVGWRGLLERESGSDLPALFPSAPLEAFPLLHLFADLGEMREAALMRTATRGPLASLAFGSRTPSTVLLANLGPTPAGVRVGPMNGRRVRLRLLDRYSLATARREPERFRASARRVDLRDGYATVRLRRYAYARLDIDDER